MANQNNNNNNNLIIMPKMNDYEFFKMATLINNNNNNNIDNNDVKSVNDGNDNNKLKQNVDEEDKITPEHYARRPMNAFLIFCKRHRGIVREKYPNLENRSITKILGDWWANLDKEEKNCYVILAKQYKDAFFSANPNFKWYKLPAPPLRSLTNRPNYNDDGTIIDNDNSCLYKDTPETITNRENIKIIQDKLNVNNINNNNNINQAYSNKFAASSVTDMGVFKLADETQMGGLSSLLSDCEKKNQLTNNNNNAVKIESNLSTEMLNLGNESDNQNSCDAQSVKTCHSSEPFSNMRTHAEKMQLDTMKLRLSSKNRDDPVGKKRKLNNDKKYLFNEKIMNNREKMKNEMNNMINYNKQNVKFININNNNIVNINKNNNETLNTEEEYVNKEIKCQIKDEKINTAAAVALSLNNDYDQFNKKTTTRACKGKRYLEFMNSGKLNSFTKKVKNKTTYNNAVVFPHNGYCKTYNPNLSNNNLIKMQHNINKNYNANFNNTNNNNNNNNNNNLLDEIDNELIDNTKIFDASDFDLEKKIKALPALCLDDYLSRKRETKKKKSPGQKRSPLKTTLHNHNPYTMDDANNLKNKKTMVGSQKRKARKESITRRDIVALNINPTNNNNNNIYFNNNNDDSFNDNNNKTEIYHTKHVSGTIANKTLTSTTDQQTTASDLFILATLATLADEKIKT